MDERQRCLGIRHQRNYGGFLMTKLVTEYCPLMICENELGDDKNQSSQTVKLTGRKLMLGMR